MNFDHTINEVRKYLAVPRRIIITTHIRPDGDAMGSSLALFHFLMEKGHQVTIILPSDYPKYFSWFPGAEHIHIFREKDEFINGLISESDLLIAVDFNQLSRNGELGACLDGIDIPTLLIDHHPEPDSHFTWKIWDTSYCASGEAVFEFIESLDETMLRNQDIAVCIYAAIISDSGSFSFSSVSGRTFRIAARLVDSGIDHESVQRNVFNNFTEKRLRFWAFCILERMTISPQTKLAYIVIYKDDLKKYEVKPHDTENLVNFPMMLEEVLISVLIMERDEYVKMSFRSKGNIPVNTLAKDYFNGGGHVNAAGGESFLSLEDTIVLLNEKVGLLAGVSD